MTEVLLGTGRRLAAGLVAGGGYLMAVLVGYLGIRLGLAWGIGDTLGDGNDSTAVVVGVILGGLALAAVIWSGSRSWARTLADGDG